MKFEIDFWPGSPEAAIIGEAIVKLGNIRTGMKDQDMETGRHVPGTHIDAVAQAEEPQPDVASPLLLSMLSGAEAPTTTITEVKAETSARTPRKRRQPQPVPSETIAQVERVTAAEQTPVAVVPAVSTIVPEVSTPAAKVYGKEELENMVRAMARTRFDEMAALLGKYGVVRFGLLPVEKHQEFAAALVALGPA